MYVVCTYCTTPEIISIGFAGGETGASLLHLR